MRRRVILLVGLPGAGKSTVGAIVAARLGLPFVDLDRVIETEAGLTVEEIFAREGEPGFRRREQAATSRLSGDLVLAPGGGWVEDPRNRELLGPGLLSVYLRVSPPVALARLQGSSMVRPLLKGHSGPERLRELLKRREATYLQSDHTITVDSMTPGEVATSIVAIASGLGAD